MYQVKNGEKTLDAFSIRQALFHAEDIGSDCCETTITLPDGCVLIYDFKRGDLICKSPTTITFATPAQAASIFGFFFEGIENGWIDLTQAPQMRKLHDWLMTKQGCKVCGGSVTEFKADDHPIPGFFPLLAEGVVWNGTRGSTVDYLECERCGRKVLK